MVFAEYTGKATYGIIELCATVFKSFIYIESFHLHNIGVLGLRERNGDTDVKHHFKGHRDRTWKIKHACLSIQTHFTYTHNS